MTITTDDGDGTTTTTDNGGGTTSTDNGDGTTTTTNNEQHQSGEGIGCSDVAPTYSPTKDVKLPNVALASQGGMDRGMAVGGAIGGVLIGIVILGMIAVAFFVRGKKPHRGEEDDEVNGIDNGIKIVPSSTLPDSNLENGDEDEDDGINSHSAVVNANSSTAADDAYYNLCCAPRDVETPMDKEEDRALDRLMTNSLKACATTSKEDSEAPQLNYAAVAATAACDTAVTNCFNSNLVNPT
jgi:hypothetical protein